MGNFVSNYKDLEIWKSSFNLCVSVYKVTERLPRKEVYAMADQLNRASVSVSSNIAEGYQSGSHAMFLRYLYIARESLAETETQMLLIKELYFNDDAEIPSLIEECTEIMKMINKFIAYLKRKQTNGLTY